MSTQPEQQSSKVGHTPTPWKAGDAAWFRGRNNPEDGKRPITATESGHSVIANVYGKANAEFIVRACNSHEDLVAALQTFLDWGTTYMTPLGEK